MKTRIIAIIVSVAMLSSCTTNYYAVQQNDGTIDWSTMKKFSLSEVKESKMQTSATASADKITYDLEGPTHIRVPKLIEPSKGYVSSDQSTFPVYADAQVVAEPLIKKGKSTVAIWCTKEATYVAQVTHHNWKRTYYQQSSDTYIRDCKTDARYYIKDKLGLPLDQTYFIDGVSGEYICVVCVFPPLPETCTVIDICGPAINDHIDNAPGWDHDDTCKGMSVSELQANQKITEYVKTNVIE